MASRRATVSHEQFVRAISHTDWSRERMAVALGMTPNAVSQRARFLRSRGVNIPFFTCSTVLDVVYLNSLLPTPTAEQADLINETRRLRNPGRRNAPRNKSARLRAKAP